MAAYRVTLNGQTQPKTFTLGQLFDAIEQNGLEQIQGAFYRDLYGIDFNTLDTSRPQTIDGACAIGMASINLGISATDIPAALADIDREITNEIADMNDIEYLTFQEIADRMRTRYAKQLHEEFTVYFTIESQKID